MQLGLTLPPFAAGAAPQPSEESRENAGALVALFGALADPTRLRIITLLRAFELAVGEIAHLLEQSQPRVSRHIRLLEESGLVERRREGSWVFVRLCLTGPGGPLLAAMDSLTASDAEQRVLDRDRRRLGAVLAERDAAAARYFAAHAGEWDAIRSLHVAEHEVEQAIIALLAGRPLGHLLDIGTGTGRMAAILRAAASQVTAIDRSPEMLRIARSKLAGTAPVVDFVHGDFAAVPLAADSIDTAVMHQVLHYATSPDAVILEAARMLRPDGRLLIVDFASHDREDLRRDAAHARLGFSDAQIREWFTRAHIAFESSLALSGGELTVKLWLGRRRRHRAPPLSDRKTI